MSLPSKPDVVDSKGRPVVLGALLGQGGEGTVYRVERSGLAAKIYKPEKRAARGPKVRAMVNMRTDNLGNVAAWPTDSLILRGSGQPVGLLMPLVDHKKNVHHVYGPKSRLKDFPRADWRFLVRTAANVARAFASVHDANCVIGDVNHGSIMVGEDATVSLIDCDSFQISTKFLCEVGVETFTPPELQGKPFAGVVRTANFDNFGLAVMIFHLLFMGRHPFAGRYLGSDPMPIARAIRECRFPYGAQRRAVQMEQPPGTPPLSFVGSEVAQLFEKAFSRTAVGGGRPSAREWMSALVTLEKNTKQCSVSRSHWHPGHAGSCPWCNMEGQGANPLFHFVLPLGMQVGAGDDVESLVRALAALGDPGAAPPLAVPDLLPSPEALAVGEPNKAVGTIGFLVALCVFIGGTIAKPPLWWLFGVSAFIAYHLTLKALSKDDAKERFRKRQADAEEAFQSAQSNWERQAGGSMFYEARARFLNLKAEVDDIPKKRLAALDALKAEQRKRQLNRFLEAFEIEDAQIDGIGPGRKRVLESYGIEAADDIVINRLKAVPGFGPKMISRLVGWRKSIEAKFSFDPSRAIDPRDIAKVEQDILAWRTQLMTSVRTAHRETIQAHAEIMKTRQAMKGPLEQLARTLGQARADYKLVRGGDRR